MTSHLTTFRPGEIVRIRGQRWIVVRQLAYASAAVLEVSGCDRTSQPVRARFVLPVEPIALLPSSRVPRLVRPLVWRHVARRVLADALSPNDLLRTIAAADASVFPFQLEPALAVMCGLGSRVLIADDVGLGKTVQAGLIVAELLARAPDAHVLIVSPAGLRDQWRHELESRFGIDVTLIDSATLARRGSLGVPGANPWRASGVVIASIDYVKRPEVSRSFEATIWDAVVFDEAHALSGRSDRAEAAAALSDRARLLIMLSATPHSGDEDAFARVCNLGNLKHDFPLLVFRRTRQDVGIAVSRRTTWLRVRPTSQEAELHKVLMEYARDVWKRPSAMTSGAQLAMTVLVTRAYSSSASLARSIARRLTLLESADLSTSLLQPSLPFGGGTQDDEPITLLMAAGLDDVGAERRWLLRILELAHAASNQESKLQALTRLLRRTPDRAIVFTAYRDTLAQVAACLRDSPVAILHGGLTVTERAESVRHFTDGDARLLLATDAASEGLNLQRGCRLVVNLELPWSPLRLEQRIGRVDRLGQRRRVHAVHCIAAGTGEESTVARLFLRMARIESSTTALRRPTLEESDVARSVIGQETLFRDPGPGARDSDLGVRRLRIPDPESQPPTLPPHVIVPELRSAAQREADRASTARLLGAGMNTALVERPVVTRVRRGLPSPHVYWAFRLGYDDESGSHEWAVLVGVGEALHVRAATRAGARHVVSQHTAAARSAAMAAQRDLLNSLRERLLSSAERATTRELAILEAVRQHHARIAARLLQPGLFDHRAERSASAQSSVLSEVLAHGAERLQELKRHANITVGACDLLFAVIVD